MSKEYIDFVNSVTSESSKKMLEMVHSFAVMEEQGAIPSRVLTTALGLNGEASEFYELIKKCVFQGKEYNEDTKNKLKSELSDIMWYIAQGCIALDTTIDDLIEINTSKLKERYPDGFDKNKSNARYVNE